MNLDGYFRKFTDKLAYLELKEDSPHKELNDLPLPIYLDDMKSGIISGDMGNQIDTNLMIQGMFINLGADPDFRYNEEYKAVIQKFLPDAKNYASSIAINYISDDYTKAILLLRGGYIYNASDTYNSYLYARYLWPLAFDGPEEYQSNFIRESIRILQATINMDPNMAISYYELGNIYTNLGEYIKARNYYNKALSLTEVDEARDEIRDKLTEINDNAEIEEALYYIGKSDYNGAIKKLTGLLSNKKRPDAYYYLGVAYQNIGQFENSVMAFANALDGGAEFRELYNDYAISLYDSGRIDEALTIIDEGLRKYPSDPRITYNKIQINLMNGSIGQAKADIDDMLTFDDLSDELKNNLLIIKEQFNI